MRRLMDVELLKVSIVYKLSWIAQVDESVYPEAEGS
jgi:hypothetical protein